MITSDLAYVRDGYVFMLGRADDIINVGGEKVSPIEVENVACLYEGISDCACIGVDDPDGVMGQIPVLFVVPRGASYSEDAFKGFLASSLDRYKQPQRIVLVESIPRNRNKKTDRRELRRLWKEGSDNSMCNGLMNETVRSILSRKSVRRFTSDTIDRKAIECF